jgi:very-short-patch-repair endonuclease
MAAHEDVSSERWALAKRLRRALTPAERRLWHALKGHRFAGLQFRRQGPMGPYIADFACHRAKVIIEVDGAQHGYSRRAAADRARDAWFAGRGYRVLRFWNTDVLKDFDSVLNTIYTHMPAPLLADSAP